MPSPLIHFDVKADDIDRAIKFYENVFGWKAEQYMNKDNGAPFSYWGLITREEGKPGINGGLMKRSDNESMNYSCTIQVDDIDKTLEDLKANGGTVVHDKDMLEGVGWMAGAKDSEGNFIGIMQATDWKAK